MFGIDWISQIIKIIITYYLPEGKEFLWELGVTKTIVSVEKTS